MSYVVAGTCLGCKCGGCAQMCPVDAIREGEMMLFIDPEKCIDCGACRGQCGRGAIFRDEELPEAWEHYKVLNEEESKRFPAITSPQEPIGFPNWECTPNRPVVNRDSMA
ncbi:MAG: 4Fe-4S binding protein [Planctomycetaceae bacterium]|nr:4Fe-4S binding protein [Planctomycetaceae bacterium]